MNKKIIGWYPYSTIVENVGINGEQYTTITNYEPIYEGETEEDAKIRLAGGKKVTKKKKEKENES